MSLQVLMGVGSAANIQSCSASGTDSSWTASGTSSTVASANRTITVPAGNSGVLKLAIVNAASGTMKYSKNNGAFTSFVLNDTITLANNDTLKFEITGSGVGSLMSGPVNDNTTGTTIGNVNIDNSS